MFAILLLVYIPMDADSVWYNLFDKLQDEPGASEGVLSPEVLGLVFSGSVPVVGS